MKIRLSTGKEVYANHGIIGLGPEPEFQMSEGYDGMLTPFETEHAWDEDLKETDSWVLSLAERIEICNLMIARWQTLKTRLEAE